MNRATDLLGRLRIQARANRLANHRLHTAMTPLSRADMAALGWQEAAVYR